MPVVLLGVAAVAVVAFLAARGNGGAPGTRVYTKADGKMLRELILRRRNLGLTFKRCMAKASENNKSVLDVYVGSLAGFAGLVTGSVTADPSKGVAVFRSITKGYSAMTSKDAPCKKEYDEIAPDLAVIDDLTTRLGFPLDVPDDVIQAAWASIGGDNFDAVVVAPTTKEGRDYVAATGFANGGQSLFYSTSEIRTWNYYVRTYGLKSAEAKYKAGLDRDDNGQLVGANKPAPPHDPVTGIAIDPRTGKPAAEF